MDEKPDQRLGNARTAYKAAVDNLSNALIRFYSADVPMQVDPDGIRSWTDPQIRATAGLKEAWVGLVETRKAYDDLIFNRPKDQA